MYERPMVEQHSKSKEKEKEIMWDDGIRICEGLVGIYKGDFVKDDA